MDDTKQPDQQRPINNPTPVMDVQPPKQPQVRAETSGVDNDSSPSQSAAPVKNPPLDKEETQTEASNVQATQKHDQPQPTTNKNKSSKPAVYAVIIIAILLSVGAIAVYFSTNKNTEDSAGTETAPIAQTERTTNDVDNTVKAIDDNLTSLEQAEEFSESALTDEALGL